MKTFVSIALLLMMSVPASAMSLREAADIAVANNPSLQRTKRDIDTARQDVKIARGQKGLSVSLSGSFSADKSEGVQESESASSRVTGSIPLYSGRRLESAIRSAELGVDIAQLNFDQSTDDLIYQVTTAYVNALENRATAAVDVETRDNLVEHEKNIEALYVAGSKAKIDWLRATVETSNAAQDVARSHAAYEVSLTQLATLLSLDAIGGIEVEDFFIDSVIGELDHYIRAAEENRNDLKADELKIEQGEVQVTSAKSGWLPEVSASAGTGFSARSRKWDPTSDASAGVSASWSIFDSKVTRARVDEAEIAVEQLKLAMQSDVESVREDVVTAYKNLRSALVRFDTTQKAVELAEEERYIATERYRAGEGILLDVLDAEVALSTAKKNHVSAKYDVIRYHFQLSHAMGNTLNR
ncbi:MAG: TolC family protein [Selenomonadaceae bacterium]|nr:TolC family protein [Selenomonadaceae bacterium]